jgi:hypothetical protein
MSRAGRWTVTAGRQIDFDGQPFVSIGREGSTVPVEADSATHFIAECLNQAGMTPDELYRRHMGHPRRRSRNEELAPRSAHASPVVNARSGRSIQLKTYEIHEEGWGQFTTIEARSAEEALRIAERRFPRRSVDYNGYVGPVTWRAFGPDGERALLVVQVSDTAPRRRR